jgi:hypothetical protein
LAQDRDADYWSMIGTAAPEISSLRAEPSEGEAIEVPESGGRASIECEPQEDDGYGTSYLNCPGVVGRS